MSEETVGGILVFDESANDEFRDHVRETLETSEFIDTKGVQDCEKVLAISEVPDQEADNE